MGITGDNGALFVDHVHHVKFVDCGAYTTADAYNAPIAIFRSGYALVEGCYIWGSGRMRIMFYICDNSIMRRNVGRLDHVSPGDPIGGWDLYSSQHCRTQNNIMIDSDQISYYTNYTNDAGVWVDQSGSSNGETWSEHLDNKHEYNIALNLDMGLSLMQYRTDSDPLTLLNSIAWNIRAVQNTTGEGIAYPILTLYGASDLEQNTFGNWTSPYYSLGMSNGVYFADYTGSAHTTINNIIYSLAANGGSAGSGPVFSGINSAAYNDIYLTGTINAGSSTVTNTISTNPVSSTCLKYLPRLETGCSLLTAGQSGARVGANVLYMIGASGTLFGDTNYDTVTTASMWPFPHEDLIKTQMQAYNTTVSGNRGFASSTATSLDGSAQTLTKYIWEYLGNQIPPEIYNSSTSTKSTDKSPAITVQSTSPSN